MELLSNGARSFPEVSPERDLHGGHGDDEADADAAQNEAVAETSREGGDAEGSHGPGEVDGRAEEGEDFRVLLLRRPSREKGVEEGEGETHSDAVEGPADDEGRRGGAPGRDEGTQSQGAEGRKEQFRPPAVDEMAQEKADGQGGQSAREEESRSRRRPFSGGVGDERHDRRRSQGEKGSRKKERPEIGPVPGRSEGLQEGTPFPGLEPLFPEKACEAEGQEAAGEADGERDPGEPLENEAFGRRDEKDLGDEGGESRKAEAPAAEVFREDAGQMERIGHGKKPPPQSL